MMQGAGGIGGLGGLGGLGQPQAKQQQGVAGQQLSGLQLGQVGQQGALGLNKGLTQTSLGGLQSTQATGQPGLALGGLGGLGQTVPQLGQKTLGTGGLQLGGLAPLPTHLQSGGPKLGTLPSYTATLGATPGGLTQNTISTNTGLNNLSVTAGGLGLKTLTTATGGVGQSTLTTTTTTQSKGLGGVDPASISASGKTPGSQPPMETALHSVLEQLVANFERFLKIQKDKSDEISKFSDSGLKKVKQDTSSQTQSLGSASALITKSSQVVGHLRSDTTEEFMNAKVAQRTNELPAGFQHENTAPDLYFQKLLNSFEAKMELYKREIEALESHLSVAGADSGMSPQNIVDILQLQYKPFLILAAQLQTTHEQVQKLKDQYLNYRRIVLQDNTDVFEERRRAAKKAKIEIEVPTGPSPFASTLQMTTGLTTYPATGLGPGVGGLGIGTGIGGVGGTGLGNLGGGAGMGSLGTTTGVALGTGAGIGGLGSTGMGGLGGLGAGIGGLGTGTGIGGLGAGIGNPGLQTSGLGLGTNAPGLTLNSGLGTSLSGSISQPSLGTITSTQTNNLTGGAFKLGAPPTSKKRQAT